MLFVHFIFLKCANHFNVQPVKVAGRKLKIIRIPCYSLRTLNYRKWFHNDVINLDKWERDGFMSMQPAVTKIVRLFFFSSDEFTFLGYSIGYSCSLCKPYGLINSGTLFFCPQIFDLPYGGRGDV